MCRSHLSVTSGEQQRDQLRQQGAPALLVSGLLAECTAFTEQLPAEGGTFRVLCVADAHTEQPGENFT